MLASVSIGQAIYPLQKVAERVFLLSTTSARKEGHVTDLAHLHNFFLLLSVGVTSSQELIDSSRQLLDAC